MGEARRSLARSSPRQAKAASIGIWLERIWQDLRHGGRLFAKNPGFTAIAVISIALGTGANVAMFSVADALLLRPPPVARPSELLTIGSVVDRGFMKFSPASDADYVDIHRYDFRMFLLVVPMLLAVTVFAAFVPARRAARVDPTVALRCD